MSSDFTITERVRPLFLPRDQALVATLRQGLLSGECVSLPPIRGFVTAFKHRPLCDGVEEITYTIRPLEESDRRYVPLNITLRPTGGPVFPNQQPVMKESTMKVFETIIVTVDAQNVITGIAQPVKLITAHDSQAAKDATLVDYAVENKISGKDLAGFKVRTREFCG